MRALLKANAKENLRGNWGTAILVLLIAHVLLSASYMVVAVGELILLGPLETGVALVFLKLSYREPAEVGDLFQPFQNFVNTFFAGFLSAIFTFLWSLLFVIPGIVKALSYSQVYYIMCDHPEYTGREAIDASREMMRGHKGELFVQMCIRDSLHTGAVVVGVAYGQSEQDDQDAAHHHANPAVVEKTAV